MRIIPLHLAAVGLFLAPVLGLGNSSAVAAACAVCAIIAVLGIVELQSRRLDTRGLALLAGIAAIDSALRLAVVIGVAGFSPIFLLILATGYVFGTSYGFLCGTLVLAVSAIATGGVGPWLPYEMLAAGWVGAFAGIAGRRRTGAPSRRDVVVLCMVGLISGFAYGALTDLWDWTTFYRGIPDIGWIPGLSLHEGIARFTRFYFTTSFTYDAFRAVGNAAMVIALGPAILFALVRVRLRLSLQTEPVTADEPPLSMPATSSLPAAGDEVHDLTGEPLRPEAQLHQRGSLDQARRREF